jgi:putative redox protein
MNSNGELKMEINKTTTMTLPAVTITSAGGPKFVATTDTGNEIFLEPSPALGGSGKIPNPLEYYIAAIGGCAAIKTMIDLTAQGMAPESILVRVACTRSGILPQILTAIHLGFTLKGDLAGEVVAAVIDEVMNLHCPVAVMATASATVTWEHTIEPD